MGKSQKDKGKAGERELCKIMESYLGGSWVKTSSSGAFIGGSNKVRESKLDQTQIHNLKADIVTPEHLNDLVIEAKWYKDFPFFKFFKGSVPKMDEWIDDLENDGSEKTHAWICMKFNNKGWLIGLRESTKNLFTINNYLLYHHEKNNYIITGMHDFLENNNENILNNC